MTPKIPNAADHSLEWVIKENHSSPRSKENEYSCRQAQPGHEVLNLSHSHMPRPHSKKTTKAAVIPIPFMFGPYIGGQDQPLFGDFQQVYAVKRHDPD